MEKLADNILRCCFCKAEKQAVEFYRDNRKRTGRKPRCKICEKLYINRNLRRKYEKEYRIKNLERRAAIVKKSNRKNKEHHRVVRSKYLKTPTGMANHRKHGQTRRCRVKLAFIEPVDPMILFTEQNGYCYLCLKKFIFTQMEMDHIIPISKGGKHKKSNTKMACRPCNRSKGAKIMGGL